MGAAFAEIALGLAALSLTSLALWFAANRLRSPGANSIWASDGTASVAALLLVAALLVSGAILVKGLLEVTPDPLIAVAVGIVVSAVAPIILYRVIDSALGLALAR